MKRTISLALFIVIAIIVWWSATEDHGDSDPLHVDKDARYVEIFMEDFEITAMDDSGHPGYILNGTHLQKLNQSDDTEITAPVLRLLQQNNKWKVTAEKAVLNEKKNSIDLIDDVVMQQQNNEPVVTIRTQKLRINTKKQTAFTRARVKITQGNSVIRSDGMVFDNQTSKLKLTSNVNGYFLPLEN